LGLNSAFGLIFDIQSLARQTMELEVTDRDSDTNIVRDSGTNIILSLILPSRLVHEFANVINYICLQGKFEDVSSGFVSLILAHIFNNHPQK
jgi:hypothetical protein